MGSEGRAYELVSPPAKNGGEVSSSAWRVRAAADGSAVAFISLSGFGDVQGMSVASEYLSVRAGDGVPVGPGWATHAIMPAQEPGTLGSGAQNQQPMYVGEFSDDLDHGIFRALSPLTAAPNVAEAINLYAREDLRTPGAGTYQLVTDCPVCIVPLTPEQTLLRATNPGFAAASADFQHVIFESTLRLATGGGGNTKLYEWVGGRVGVAGILPNATVATRSLAGRGAILGERYTSQPIADDGSRIVFTSASGSATSGQIHMRINGRSTVRLDATERTVAAPTGTATFWDASTDASRVFFTSTEALTDDAPTIISKLYMWRLGATDEVQSVTVNATGGTFTLSFQGQTTRAIAFDATAAVVEAALAALTTVGAGNVGVLGGPGDGTGSSPYLVRFVGDFAGANVAALTASRALLTGGAATATVTTTTPVRNLTLLSVDGRTDDGASVQGVFGASDDGRYVHFAALGQLVAGEDPVDNGIYTWHDGALAYVGRAARFAFDSFEWFDGSPLPFGRQNAAVTPDGRHLLFPSSSGDRLLSEHGGVDYSHGFCSDSSLPGCREFYLYDADADTLRCVSCNATGANAEEAEGRVRYLAGASPTTNHLSRLMSDDGRYAFFTTGEALVPEDVNGRKDAYVFDTQTGRHELLSSGTSPYDSYFLDAGASGHDAFFTTREPLVGWDVDEAYDLYDARIGGGFPDPLPLPPPCIGDDCQGPPGGSPSARDAGSAATRGAGNVAPGDEAKPPQGVRCRRGKVKKRIRGRVRCVRKRRGSRRSGSRGNRAATTREVAR